MTQTSPVVYVKTGCPWCDEALAYLKKHNIPFTQVVVSGNHEAMAEMVRLSGQSKAPTMNWNGEILADFGVDELIPFLKSKGL